MEDPRELFVRFTKTKTGFHVDEGPSKWTSHVHGAIREAIFYTIVAYRRYQRDVDELGMGLLEKILLWSDDFINDEDAKKWIEMNRMPDDTWLIIQVYDHIKYMENGSHRRALLYLFNMLHFDL